MVCLVAMQGVGNMAPKHELLKPVHDGGNRRALLEPGLEVARDVQLLMQPALLESLWVGRQHIVLATLLQGCKCRFGGQHAALDGRVTALDSAGIEVTSVVAHQGTARKNRLGKGQQTTGSDSARTIRNTLARLDAVGFIALQVPADVGVGLPALHFFKRAEPGVGVIQPCDEPERNLVVLQVVQESTAVGVVVQWPASGMYHQAGFVAGRVNLPQFLDAQAIGLRVATLVKLVFGNDLFAQMAARTLGEHGVFAQKLHAQLEVACQLAIFANTHVAGCHTTHRTVFVVKHFSRSEAWEYLNAQAFSLFTQPLGHIAQADDVVAVVLKALGQQKIGDAKAALFPQENHGVVGDRLVQGGAQRFPVGDQFRQGTRVHDSARQDVCPRFRAFLKHNDRNILARFSRHLLESDRCGQAARATSDHDHVVFHGFAGAVCGQDFFVGH